jgi:hypothetical protein
MPKPSATVRRPVNIFESLVMRLDSAYRYADFGMKRSTLRLFSRPESCAVRREDFGAVSDSKPVESEVLHVPRASHQLFASERMVLASMDGQSRKMFINVLPVARSRKSGP